MFLLPYKTRFVAAVLLIASSVCAYLYFLGGRPEFFNIKIFALVSAYLETRYFVIAQTNILDELAAILLLAGIAAFSFSKLKTEKPEYQAFRIKALVYSIFIALAFWILSFLLIYGMAIFLISSGIFIFYLISYNTLFYYFILKNKFTNTALAK